MNSAENNIFLFPGWRIEHYTELDYTYPEFISTTMTFHLIPKDDFQTVGDAGIQKKGI